MSPYPPLWCSGVGSGGLPAPPTPRSLDMQLLPSRGYWEAVRLPFQQSFPPVGRIAGAALYLFRIFIGAFISSIHLGRFEESQ